MKKMVVEEAIAALKVFGVPYVFLEKKRDYSWDGETLAIYPEDKPSGIIHELGHWLLVSDARRKKIDFGLGPGFRSIQRTKSVVKDPQPEEVKVCLFEIGVSFMYGCNWKAVARHDCFDFKDYWTWDRFLQNGDLPNYVEELRKKRFFVGNIPTIVPRRSEIAPQVAEAREEWQQFLKTRSV